MTLVTALLNRKSEDISTDLMLDEPGVLLPLNVLIIGGSKTTGLSSAQARLWSRIDICLSHDKQASGLAAHFETPTNFRLLKHPRQSVPLIEVELIESLS